MVSVNGLSATKAASAVVFRPDCTEINVTLPYHDLTMKDLAVKKESSPCRTLAVKRDTAAREVINVCFLIDHSMSMGSSLYYSFEKKDPPPPLTLKRMIKKLFFWEPYREDRKYYGKYKNADMLDMAKQYVRDFLRQHPDSCYRVSIIGFADFVSNKSPFTKDKKEAEAFLDPIVLSGYEIFSPGVSAALNQLELQQGKKILVILSDVNIDANWDVANNTWIKELMLGICYVGFGAEPDKEAKIKTLPENALRIFFKDPQGPALLDSMMDSQKAPVAYKISCDCSIALQKEQQKPELQSFQSKRKTYKTEYVRAAAVKNEDDDFPAKPATMDEGRRIHEE